MAASKLIIYNAALRLISARPVGSVGDGSKNDDVLGDLYDTVLRDLLAAGNWKFAKKTAALVINGTAPAAGYDYAWDLPSDWVRTIGAWDNDAKTGHLDYDEEIVDSTQTLVCDIDSTGSVYIEYVYLITDTTQHSAKFDKALIFALAQAAAVPIANSNTIEDQMAKKARQALLSALSVDSLNVTPDRRPKGSWVTRRPGRYDDSVWPR